LIPLILHFHRISQKQRNFFLYFNKSFAFSLPFHAFSMTSLLYYLAVNLAQYTIIASFLNYSALFPAFFLVIYLTLLFFYIFLNFFVFPLAFFFQFPYTFKHGVVQRH